jgi:tetrahydromethanopterin S-methyltransferase subunit C
MRHKGRLALPGLGMMGAAGVVALLAGGALTAFLVLVLSLFLDEWLAALVVGVLLAAVAAALGLAGKERVEEMGTPLPEQTIETVKEDAAWMKEQAKSGRR